MEWNARSTLPWDWDNLVMFNVKADGEIENGSFHSYGGGGGSGSDVGHGSSSKGSINSSLKGEMKTSKFTLETSEGSPIEFSKRKELAVLEVSGTSPTLEASIGSGEHLLGLKLGKRTYFEDVCAGTSANPSYFSAVPTSSSIMAKRARASCQSTQALRCQVEGCNLDLTLAKDYHRRHRVCESHSKCTKVIVAGLERRFCQQCSRFHALSEFDENKRSCRKRLSEHNARRRKPPPEAIHFKSTMLSPSLCDGKQQMNLVFNGLPFVHTMPAVNPMWESTCSPKFKQTKGSLLWPEKAGIDGQLHLPSDELTNAITTRHHDPHRFLPSKGTTAEVLNKDLEASVITSSLDATSDLRRALSLLSTNSWGSDEPELTSLDRLMRVNYSKMDQPVLHAVSHGLPLTTSEYWQAEQQSVDSQVHSLVSNSNGNNQFQGFQLFKAPSEPGFFFQ